MRAAVPRQVSAKDRQALDLLASSDHPIVHSFPHGALIVYDHDLRHLSAGGLGLANVGLSRELLEGKTIFEAFPAETAAVLEPHYRAALTGESSSFDVPYGGRMFSLKLAPIHGEDGLVLAGMAFSQDVTDTRLGEQQLRESEQRFRLAFQHAPIGIAIVGLDGLFREVNPALCRLLDHSPETLRSLTFQDITHPDDLEKDLSLLTRLVAGEIDSYALEKRYFTSSGELVWALLTVSLVLGDDLEPLYFVSQIQDITDRKMTEQATERVFRSAFEDALVGMCLVGLDGTLLVVNPVFEALLERGSADLVGRPFAEFTHPDDLSANLDQLQQTQDGTIPGFKSTTRYLRPDGTIVHAELSTSLVRSDDGAPLYLSTQTVDVTARWVAERERDTRDLMLRGVIANSQSLVYVKDLDGRYLLANEPFERAFGVTEAELLGQDDTYLDPQLAQVWRANDLRAQREHYQVEEWSDGPDGRVYYESVKFPLRDPDGAVYATCGISLDVTETRQAAEAMALARDAALTSAHAKSAFLATMSHEIRTPMNAVIGLTGLLLESELDARQRGFAETIRHSGDALLAIINNVLDFSSLEARGTVLEELPFSLQACVDEAVALAAPAAGELELMSYVDPACPTVVVGDSHRLRQVLVNLLANALKFTETGEVVLTVAPTGTHDELVRTGGGTGDHESGVALAFTVRDTGIGIAADRLDRLFASFSQVDTSTTRLYGGSGLGLAISKSLVEAMGGTIGVTSTPGVGSTFQVDLVLPTDTDPDAVSSPSDLAGVRMLVVDDNASQRGILRLQLEAAGVVVEVADGGAGALAALESDTFDLALIDLRMPDMGGEQLAARIRSSPATAALPLVVLTGLAAAPAHPGLFDAQHSKPVRLMTLCAELADVLRDGGVTPPDAGDDEVDASPVSPPLRVLLVEDNLVNQGVGRAMLTRLGHHVDIADNGFDALQHAQRTAYDVVLMDVHMPVMDGLKATAAIRTQLPTDHQPHIIALTASSMDQDRRACADAGMDGFLLKPVRLDGSPAPWALSRLGPRHRSRLSRSTTRSRRWRPCTPGSTTSSDPIVTGPIAGSSSTRCCSRRRSTSGLCPPRWAAPTSPPWRPARTPWQGCWATSGPPTWVSWQHRCTPWPPRVGRPRSTPCSRACSRSSSSSGGSSHDRDSPPRQAPGRLGPVAAVRVLVVDDDPVSLLMAAAIVRRLGHEVTTATDGDDAWRQLQAVSVDVVISDREMPVVDGLELCRRLRQGAVDPDGTTQGGPLRYTYLILVTAHDTWDDALVGMRAGADDYLSKPVSPAHLELRLIAAQRVTDLHRSLERQQRELVELGRMEHALARTDPLTSLPNRLAMQEELDRFQARVARHAHGFSVAMFDVDHFKSFNDTAGHLEGDRVLKLVAQALAGQVRSTDGFYRYGGEEFALLLDTTDPVGAFAGAERLRLAVQELGLAHPARPGESVSVSVGVAQHDASRPEAEAVLADADAALYRAKQSGRNRTCRYEPAEVPQR